MVNKTTEITTESAPMETNLNPESDQIRRSSTIHQVQSIEIHQSKFQLCNKQRSLNQMCYLSPYPGSVDSRSIGDKSQLICCTTSFRIEPQFFRKERVKKHLERKYSIKDLIGKGGFGEVKKIKDKDNNLDKALKIVSKDKCQMTNNFADEIEIIKKLVRRIYI